MPRECLALRTDNENAVGNIVTAYKMRKGLQILNVEGL